MQITSVRIPKLDACQACSLNGRSRSGYNMPYRIDPAGAVGDGLDPVEVFVVGDPPFGEDADYDEYMHDVMGRRILDALKALNTTVFVLPAVRCHPRGDIDHFILKKKYKGGFTFQRKTSLDYAYEAVSSCQDYLGALLPRLRPRLVVAMGPLATEALGLGRNIHALRVRPLQRLGIKTISQEGTLVTFDRGMAAVSQWAKQDLLDDFEERLPNLLATGYATSRGNRDTIRHTVLTTVDQVRGFVDHALSVPDLLSFDYETSGLSPSKKTTRLLNVGFSFRKKENEAVVIPLSHPETPFLAEDLGTVYDALRTLLDPPKGVKLRGYIAHNAPFETSMTKAFLGVWLGETADLGIFDTMVLAYLENENRRGIGIERPYALETLASSYLDFRWYETSQIKGRRDKLIEERLDTVNEYVGIDAAVTSRLFNHLVERTHVEGSHDDLMNLAWRLYSPAIRYTSDLTLTGQIIDADLLRMLRMPNSSIQKRLHEIEEEFDKAPEVARAMNVVAGSKTGGDEPKAKGAPLFQISGKKNGFSITSPLQRKALFWDVMKLEGANESQDKFFQKMHESEMLVSLYSEYNKLAKLDNAYLAPIADFLQASPFLDMRVRPSFNLINTTSGRLSASDPNCFDAETEILTGRGWVPFPQLLDTDTVVQWHRSGADPDLVRPKIIRQAYSGPMISLRGPGLDLLVTPNHRCLLITDKGYEEVTAENHPEGEVYVAGTLDPQPIKKSVVQYEGMVYCVSVPSTFVFAYRRGHACISGNSQQMPRGDTRDKKQIKALFKAPTDHVLVQLDFSQAEVRWLGILSGDEALARKYALAEELKEALLRDPSNKELQRQLVVDGDLHMSTALDMYRLPRDLPFTDEAKAKKARQDVKACVHPDTLIGINHRLRHAYKGIKEVTGIDPADGLIHPLLGVSVWDGRGGNTKVKAVYPLIKKRGCHVITRRGALTCSHDHGFLLEDGSVVDAKDLRVGQVLAEAAVPTLGDYGYPVLRGKAIKGTPPVIVALNDDVAYFAGMFSGDGCKCGHSVYVAHGEVGKNDAAGVPYANWQKTIISCLTKAGFTARPHDRAVYFGARHSQRYLALLGLIDDKKRTLRIPDWVCEAGSKAILHFLGGLFDTDGTVNRKTGMASFTTKDPVFVGQVAAAARSVGMRIAVEPCWNKTYEKFYYRLRIMADDAFRILKPYMKHIGKAALLASRKVKSQQKNVVISVEQAGDIPCLDLSVSTKDHIYVTNGLLTHNTCFGLIYGKMAFSLAKDLKIEEEEAEEKISLWMSQFPQAAQWLLGVDEDIGRTGIAKSPFGRWRRLPEAKASNVSVRNRAKRQARNTPIQSAASDFCIFAACKLRDALRAHPLLSGVRLINTVHDSLVAEVPSAPEVVEAYCRLAKTIFTDRSLIEESFGVKINLPLAVDFELGPNWGNLQGYDLTPASLERCLHNARVLAGMPSGTLYSDLKGKGLLFGEKND